MRELLICPHPGIKHDNHQTNKELVVNNQFWIWILEQAVNEFLRGLCNNPYPVEGFAFNFGKWESAEAKDSNAIECHGHLHLQLTQNVVSIMEDKFNAMRGKVNDPTNYGFKNCTELETERLVGLELLSIRNSQKALKDGQEELKDGIGKIMAMLEKKNN